MEDWHQSMVEASRIARQTFDWLTTLGYRLTEIHVSDGNNARYDGWHLSYVSKNIKIRIKYYEMELDVILKKGRVETTYLLLDDLLFDNASGFQGNMFQSQKLPNALAKISDDLALHYKDILLGDTEWWVRIAQVSDEYKKRQEQESKEYMRREAQGFERLEAAEAFRAKDYARVVKLLSPIATYLEAIEIKKLDYARKKMRSGD